jgi:hypothetical protein
MRKLSVSYDDLSGLYTELYNESFHTFPPETSKQTHYITGCEYQKYRRLKNIHFKKPGNLHYLSIL